MHSKDINLRNSERAASDMSADEFRTAGHRLVDALADFYASLPDRRLTSGESVDEIRRLIVPSSLPEKGQPAGELLGEITPLLFDHSLHNGHPRFFGYITSSAAPLGALADLLAAGVNPNCGLRHVTPVANEIEQQAIAWLAELIGYPTPCGGIMVSGGNMANILGFVAASRDRLPWDVRSDGLCAGNAQPRVYCSTETHTWIQKAADLTGLGTGAIRWIETDELNRMRPEALDRAIVADRAAGLLPFLVVGTAGQVSTGAVDPLGEIAAVADKHELWLHIDGAYGAPAACLADAPEALRYLGHADSIALDPHKWLYVPIEAACTLVRNPDALRDTFSFRPPYYRLGDETDTGGLDYYEHGLQNTRGFRALKVWLCLRQAGRTGIEAAIHDNIALARELCALAEKAPELEAGSCHLSITTFRYLPKDAGDDNAYLNTLNEQLLAELQNGGDAYLSNAVIGDRYFLRACIVNFRTRRRDIEALVELVVAIGRKLDAKLRRR